MESRAMASRGGAAASSQPRRHVVWIIVTALVVALGLARPGGAAVCNCAAGDVACLIAAINMDNANGEVNLIRLEAGTYTLTAVNNDTDRSHGLPSVTSPLTIRGNGSGNTIIERAATAPLFRVFHVGQSGLLNLAESSAVAIVNSTFAENEAEFGFGGGLFVAGGDVVNTTIANNFSHGDGRALAATSALALHNTIVSGPSEPTAFACHGRVTSLDNNIFFDPNCAVALLPHDRIGDPGLGDFIDFGAPGRGFFLLSSNSQALDAGDNAVRRARKSVAAARGAATGRDASADQLCQRNCCGLRADSCEIMTLTSAGPLNAVACSSADFRSFGFSTNQPLPPKASIILS